MAGNRGITTFPDALRIFARVIVTCLRCYDCCRGRFFFFFFFCEIVKSNNFFQRTRYMEKYKEHHRFFIENIYTSVRAREKGDVAILKMEKKEDID